MYEMRWSPFVSTSLARLTKMEFSRLPSKVSRRVGNWCEEAILREVFRIDSGKAPGAASQGRIR
jgi:hypothetical protein